MPEGAVAQPGPAAAGEGQAAPAPAKQNVVWTVIRMFFIWYLFKNFFGNKSPHSLPREELLVPKFEKGFPFDMSVFLSETPTYDLSR